MNEVILNIIIDRFTKIRTVSLILTDINTFPIQCDLFQV